MSRAEQSRDKLKSTDHAVGALPPTDPPFESKAGNYYGPADFPQPDRPPQGTTPPAKRERRGPDPELTAMHKIDVILCDLEPAAIFRVLDWLNSRHDPLQLHAIRREAGGDRPNADSQ